MEIGLRDTPFFSYPRGRVPPIDGPTGRNVWNVGFLHSGLTASIQNDKEEAQPPPRPYALSLGKAAQSRGVRDFSSGKAAQPSAGAYDPSPRHFDWSVAEWRNLPSGHALGATSICPNHQTEYGLRPVSVQLRKTRLPCIATYIQYTKDLCVELLDMPETSQPPVASLWRSAFKA